MSFDLDVIDPAVLTFLAERHLASLTTLRPDGSPHVVPVGFSYDHTDRTVRIITRAHSRKAQHAARGGRAAVMQVDGGRWLTLEGTVSLTTEAGRVQRAVDGYTERYQPPRSNAEGRGAIEIVIDRIMGHA